MRAIRLIKLYCAVCHHYDNTLVFEAQRQSNNFCPKFTDAECITTYIWGIANQKFTVRGCYDFIKDFYGEWFPTLPSSQAYNARICYLAEVFEILAGILLRGIGLDESHTVFLTDSMPIILAGERRSSRAKVAPEMCSKGYCASKGMYYYGVKLHIVAQCNYKAMPTPVIMAVSQASEHDITVAKQETLDDASNMTVFCDKAFADEKWQTYMKDERNVSIVTPVKRKKGEQLSSADKLLSCAVSSAKQAIESLNNWLIEKTNIQRASKVRSALGLIAFVFARIACSCLCF